MMKRDETELFSRAPSWGRVPAIATLHRNVKRTKTVTKPSLEKAEWENWLQTLEVLTKNSSIRGPCSPYLGHHQGSYPDCNRENIPTKKLHTQQKVLEYATHRSQQKIKETYLKYFSTTPVLGSVSLYEERNKVSRICYETMQQTR